MLTIYGKRDCLNTDKAKLLVQFYDIDYEYIERQDFCGTPIIFDGVTRIGGVEELHKQIYQMKHHTDKKKGKKKKVKNG